MTRFIHLLAVATYFGATLDFAFVFLPAAEAVDDPTVQRRVLARGLKPYNLLSVGALGVLIVTGASSLTDMKALFGRDYALLLWPLVRKLSLTFALTMVATYISFGIGHRLVRAELGSLPVESDKQRSQIARMRSAAWLALLLAAWTAWIGLGLTRLPGPATSDRRSGVAGAPERPPA
jgi:hypothetical protein